MIGQGVPALLSALAAAGVRLELNAMGDGLTLSGKGRPPAHLLDAVRAAKPALLEALRPAKEDAPTSSPSPDLASWEDLPAPGPPTGRRPAPPRPDWAALSLKAGRCGSCARWTPTVYPLEGECSAGRRAHGWYDGDPEAPVLTHPGHACGAYEGKSYRARGTGKRYGLAPLPLEAGQVAP